MARTPNAAPRILFVAVLFFLTLASCLIDFGGEERQDGGEVAPSSTASAVVVTSPPVETVAAKVEPQAVQPQEPDQARPSTPWTTGTVLTAEQLQLFESQGELDKAVKKSNPRLYLRPDFDPRRETNLVIGLPGWGGRSENFVWVLINGLGQEGLDGNLAVAAIQDTRHGGPQYQGQGTRRHANTWWVNRTSVKVMRHFVSRVTEQLGNKTHVFFLGYSTGGVASSVIASRLEDGERFKVAGAISVGCATNGDAQLLAGRDQRVLFIVVPPHRPGDGRPMRDDQWNRQQAEKSLRRLTDSGVNAYLRHIPSARRHLDWHWGLISQCRYFPGKRIDSGRGYWPNYWMPNPQTSAVLAAFVRGDEPPTPASDYTPVTCPN
jgi:hypothetical protein